MRTLVKKTYRRPSPTLRARYLFLCVMGMLSITCRVNAAVWVSGQVVSGTDGKAVVGTTVELLELDASGHRIISGLYDPGQLNRLQQRLDAMHHALVPHRPGGSQAIVSHTLANGSFLLQVPKPGRYALSADASEFALLQQSIDVPPAGLTGLRLELTHPLSLKIKVLAPGGAPVSTGVIEVRLLTEKVSAFSSPGGQAAPEVPIGVTTRNPDDPTGREPVSGHPPVVVALTWRTIPAPPDGLVEVSTSRKVSIANAGAVGISARVSGVGAGWTFWSEWPGEPVTLQLVPGSTIAGKVVDANGKPLRRVQVDITGADRDSARRLLQSPSRTVSGEDGTFQFSNLLPGRADLHFFMTGTNEDHFHLLTPTAEPTQVTLGPQDRTGGEYLQFYGVRPEINTDTFITLIPGPPSGAEEPAIPISGKVMLAGVPAAGLALALTDESVGRWNGVRLVDIAVTGPDGSFVLEAIRPGHYRIGSEVQQRNYKAINRPVDVPAAGLPGVELALEKRPKIQFRMFGTDGMPVTSGAVSGSLTVDSPHSTFIAGPLDYSYTRDGVVAVSTYDGLEAAAVTGIDATIQHGTEGWAKIHLDHWPDEPVTLQLRKTGTLGGYIVDGSGNPIPRATVQLAWLVADGESAHFDNSVNAALSAGAHFAATQLPTGVYRVTATAPGYSAQSAVVHVLSEPNPLLTLHMARGQTLTIQVVDRAGRPAAEGSVQVSRFAAQQGTYPQFQPVNQAPAKGGLWSLSGLLPGTYFASARLPSGETAAQLVRVIPGKDISLMLRPEATKTIPLTVVDARGKPMGGAAIRISYISNEEQWPTVEDCGSGTLDRNGKYQLAFRDAGAYLVQVIPVGGKHRAHLIHVDSKTTAVILGPDGEIQPDTRTAKP